MSGWSGNSIRSALRRSGCSCVCAIALAAPVIAAPAPPAREVVSLCFERQDVLPWRTESGGGLNFILLHAVEEKLGVHFDFQSVPWKRCLANLQANSVDGAFAVSYKADRRELGEYPGGQQVDASKRMHIDRYVLLRRKGSKADWDGKNFHNIEGAIGFQLGYSVGDLLRNHNVEVDEGSQRADELARKLLAGRLAAAALGGSDAHGIMRSPLGAQLEELPVPLIEKPYFLILSHALVAAKPQLAERIWRAIEQVRNSPAYKKAEQAEGAGH
ncbi:transporter substrate-binding domain-containing protein [Oxalobacteraceae bacterium]|nr:transporter substrate-binding domain-containing protein [Oxalobacteraceae bacterium]